MYRCTMYSNQHMYTHIHTVYIYIYICKHVCTYMYIFPYSYLLCFIYVYVYRQVSCAHIYICIYFITGPFSSRLPGMGYPPTKTPTDSTVDPYPDPMHLWVEVYL